MECAKCLWCSGCKTRGHQEASQVWFSVLQLQVSLFYYYLALVDANYQFLWADVGGVGSQPDGQIYNASEFSEVLRSGEINLPDDAPLPNDNRPHPFFYLAGDVFPLKSNMMKPYSRRNLSFEEKIANYRISRGSRVVENAFGILALRWPFFLLSTMQQKPNVVQVIVKTTMVLHNLMRSRYPVHHQVLMDREDDNGQVTPGAWRQNANIVKNNYLQDL